jgi:hypothetical protein
MSLGEGADRAITPLPGLRNELWPLPELRFAHRENYYRQGLNNWKLSTKSTLKKTLVMVEKVFGFTAKKLTVQKRSFMTDKILQGANGVKYMSSFLWKCYNVLSDFS